MNAIISVNPAKCVGCNACLRKCPAPEANVFKRDQNGKFTLSVNPDKCIGCGECIRACVHGARDYTDDTTAFMKDIENTVPTMILVSPEIKAIYPRTWKGMLEWFREHGSEIYDISNGADICTWATVRCVSLHRVGKMIMHACSAVVNYAEIYHSEILENLAPIQSPACCEAIYVRNYLNKTEKIAVLTSCIAKNREFTATGIIDYHVTFEKLDKYFAKHNVEFPVESDAANRFYFDFDDQQGLLGTLYSQSGGVCENIRAFLPEFSYMHASGPDSVYKELEQYYMTNVDSLPDIFEVHSCLHGCNAGMGITDPQTSFDLTAIMNDVEKSVRKKRKSTLFNKTDEKMLKRFDDTLRLDDFMREYKKQKPSARITSDQLNPIFLSMGKETEESRRLNCQACGYHSCQDMAIAILRGLNDPSRCVACSQNIPTPAAGAAPVPVPAEQPAPEVKPAEPVVAAPAVTEPAPVVQPAADVQSSAASADFEEIRSRCTKLTESLSDDLRLISESSVVIQKTNEKLDEKSGAVHKLLETLLEYCNHNPTMDAPSVAQLISILEATIKAFHALDDYTSTTTSNSVVINQSIEKIKGLVSELGSVLKGEDK